MKKVGLFLNGVLMAEYPDSPESYLEAISDCKFALEETGMFHELKWFEDVIKKPLFTFCL